MKCPNCEKEILEDTKFCPYCGKSMLHDDAVNSVDIDKNDSEGIKHKCAEKGNEKEETVLHKIGEIISRILSIIALIILIIAIMGGFDNNPVPFIISLGVIMLFDAIKEKFPAIHPLAFVFVEIVCLIVALNTGTSVQCVEDVKGGSPEDYPGITYEEAFDGFFSDPKWEYIGKDEDGDQIVRFSGGCTFYDEEAVAEVDFIIHRESGIFTLSNVEINDQDMELFWGKSLIYAAFEDYVNEN